MTTPRGVPTVSGSSSIPIRARRDARAAHFSRLRPQQGQRDIYIMGRDGSRTTRLTQSLDGAGENFRPHWGMSVEAKTTTRALPLMPLPQLTAPTVSPVLSEPSQKTASGQLIYAFNDLTKAPFPSSLVLQNIEVSEEMPQTHPEATSYQIQNVEGRYGPLLFDPQFSPSGQQLTVKLGVPDARAKFLNTSPFSSYQLYALSLRAKQWRQVTSRPLYYPRPLWSPDETRIAFIAGGSSLGTAPDNLVGTYIREGYMTYPDVPSWAEPLSLYVNDGQGGAEQLVVRNSTIAYNVCWADNQTLLYALLTPDQQKQWKQQRESGKLSESTIRPNIHEYSLQTKQERLLIKDGHRPTISPDGKWIAFFGSPDPNHPFPLNEDWWLRPALVIPDRGATATALIALPSPSSQGSYPSVLWKGDGQTLITLHQTRFGADAQAEVEQWNFITGKRQKIAILKTQDRTLVENAALTPQIEALGLSSDGLFLWVRVAESSAPTNATDSPKQTTFLRALNLETGEVITLARVPDDTGLDWHNQTP